MNPLLDFSGLPRFAEIKPEHVSPAIGQLLAENLALFEKFKALRNSPEFDGLSAARKKIIENELRDFRLGGAELPEDKKARYLEIQERLSELSSRFSDNLLDATNDYALVIENSPSSQ